MSSQPASSASCRRLVGKVALITAATAGIGYSIAERLGLEGAQVFISSRKLSSVEETVQQLRALGIDASGCACHVGDDAQRKQMVAQAIKAYGRIDILVSNAAVNPAAGPLLTMAGGVVDKINDINVKAALMLVQAAHPHMQRGSAIVFISSVSAFSAPAPLAMYGVSKTALLGLTKGLAAELGPSGIRVNCVTPGVVPTKFAAAMVGDPELLKYNTEITMLKRLGKPEDMAAAVAFLVSDDAAYITAETLVVAGGMHSRL